MFHRPEEAPEEAPTGDEPGCSRPTNWAPDHPEDAAAEVDAELGSFDSMFADAVEPMLEPSASENPPLQARAELLVTELASARAQTEELQMELTEEREQRFAAEDRLEALQRDQEAMVEQRLKEMSASYHDTLSALRRAYEQRLQKAEAKRV